MYSEAAEMAAARLGDQGGAHLPVPPIRQLLARRPLACAET